MKTAEEQFPDKDKMYLSPSKESIMVYVEGEWQMFFREDIVAQLRKQTANAKAKALLEEELDIIWNKFDEEGMHGSQNYILSRINKLKEQ